MLNSLNAGVSGLEQFQNELDVIGNNIANSNTVGFKSSRTDFADAFNESLRASTAGGIPSEQIGSGVTLGAIQTNYGSASLSTSTQSTDMAISGNGFFVAKDSATGQLFATRAGNFHEDSNGYLVTSNGMRVQGYSDGGLTTQGDIKIDGTGRPATADPKAAVVDFSVDSSGKVFVKLSDGSTPFLRGQILLQNFSNPQALTKAGNNLYSNLSDAGPLGGATPQAVVPGTSGTGTIQDKNLEMSNVDLASEFANMITAQRAFQASARVITTSDEVLQELVSLKR